MKIISVQFKDKDKNFRGKLYDFKVAKAPKVGSIIRMYDKDFTKPVCNATRVRVVEVKDNSDVETEEIGFIETTLED